ncbi:MAG: NADH dehydrogenase (quinone) subunit D [Ignavibacteria bacterium GWF2_33_9]|nr:MAG: NADH dehydrogenase (quinone) subunit D [Ignavibacteria bacterium GWF2_33_9]
MTVKTKTQVEEINRIRNSKLYKELMQQDVSLLMDTALDNDMILNMGPQHPATHGVLRVVLRLDGETIVNAVPELGYLHRGYEKLAENLTYHEFIPHTDRLDYLAPMSNNVAIALAIENALGIEAPPRAQWIRTLISEMARISSHLMAIGSTCLDLGAMTVFLWTFIEREKLYDLFQEICGARFTTSYTRIGGVANDISDEILDKIKQWLIEFPPLLDKAEALVHRNRIFIDRMAGIGYLSPEKAIDLGATGPVLRASGVARDLRKSSPYLVYDQLDFDIITENDGDCLARYLIRYRECHESAKLMHQILDKMPQGEFRLNDPKTTLPGKNEIYTKMEELIHDFMLINYGAIPPKGETYTAIESPKGELGFYIISDGTGNPWKLKFRSPSTSNLQTLPEMARGSMIADMVVIIGSIDPVMGEADK